MKISVLHSGDINPVDVEFVRDQALWRELFRTSGHELLEPISDADALSAVLGRIEKSDVVFIICDERGTSLAGRYFELAVSRLKAVSLFVHVNQRDTQGELQMRNRRTSLPFQSLVCIDYYSESPNGKSLASCLQAGFLLYTKREQILKDLSSRFAA